MLNWAVFIELVTVIVFAPEATVGSEALVNRSTVSPGPRVNDPNVPKSKYPFDAPPTIVIGFVFAALATILIAFIFLPVKFTGHAWLLTVGPRQLVRSSVTVPPESVTFPEAGSEAGGVDAAFITV